MFKRHTYSRLTLYIVSLDDLGRRHLIQLEGRVQISCYPTSAKSLDAAPGGPKIIYRALPQGNTFNPTQAGPGNLGYPSQGMSRVVPTKLQ